MIPRVLHQVWLGPLPVPVELSDRWREMHPAWEYRLWRESDLRAFGLYNAAIFERYITAGTWHGAANVARLEIVERLGGVYLDMDTVPLRPLDRGPFLRDSVGLFAGYVQPREEYPELIGNAYIGAVPGHPVLRTAIRLVEQAGRKITPPWRTTGVVAFTRAVHAHQRRGRTDLYIAPTHVFFPHDKHGEDAPKGRGATYARHLWGSTIRTPWSYGDPVE